MKWEWLLSPWTLLLSLLLGVLLGMFSPKTALLLESPGILFLSLFKMCILPILVTSIISSLGHLFFEGRGAYMIKRGCGLLAALLLFFTLLNLLFIAVMRPGDD